MDGYLQQKPHFFGTHKFNEDTVNGVYCDGWMIFQPAFKMINTETFVLEDGTKVHSNIPFTYYKESQGDLSVPPASMKVYDQKTVVELLKLKTVIELICTQTGFERVHLPILEPIKFCKKLVY
jgi:hypothetical protein